MNSFKKEYKNLYKFYKKQLKNIMTKNYDELNFTIEPLLNQLSFIRDFLILTEPLKVGDKENAKISLLVSALEEYKLYVSCKNKYFKLKPDGLELLISGNKEEVLKKYNIEKKSHWTNFWKLIILNMESWVDTDVTV